MGTNERSEFDAHEQNEKIRIAPDFFLPILLFFLGFFGFLFFFFVSFVLRHNKKLLVDKYSDQHLNFITPNKKHQDGVFFVVVFVASYFDLTTILDSRAFLRLAVFFLMSPVLAALSKTF